MDGCNQSPKHDKHRSKPLEGPSFEVSDYADQACIQVFSADNEFAQKKSNSKSSEILSTPELISAVGQIWNCANDSLAHFKPARNVKHTDDVSQTGDVFWRLGGKEDSNKSDPASMSYAVNDSKFRACSTCLPQQSLQSTRVTQKRHYEPCANNFLNSFFWRNLHNISILDGDF
ncbi:hypothetical protein Nepgr_031587 [Nepenthes gracilis]|uniref:Uncharacterized protein n=1 Tax=Nepenthes gracilis TaxID=150966 RepID=A0AAD3Y781_NEPGR|nr:hypothetical protein Nepgr_031587 [Nepenthes gracilis]